MEEQNRAGDLDTYSQHVSPTVKEVSAIFDLSDDTTTMLGEDAFLTSMESGGAMLNLGHWNTTEHGMEWSDPWGLSGGQKPALANTVVKEGLFDPCGLSVIQKPVMKGAARASPAAVRSPLTPSQVSLSRHMRSGFLGIVKADPDGGWVAGSDAAVAARIAGINSPPLGTSVAPTEDSSTESVLWRAEEGTGLCGGIVKKEPLSALQGRPTPASKIPTPATNPPAPKPRRQSTRAARSCTSAPAAEAEPSLCANSKEEAEEEDEDMNDDGGDSDDAGGGGEAGPVSELSEKRRRNREHAKRSRMRKRVRLGGLEDMVLELRRENVRLRQMVKKGIPEKADDILRACAADNTDADLVAKQDVVQGMRPGMTIGCSSTSGGGGGSGGGSRSRPKLEAGHGSSSSCDSGSSGRHGDRRVPSALKLMSPSYQSVKALSESQANFILTNPNLPGCPIIFASPGFLELTGYEASQVVGKNCRFLQGPGTDAMTISIIRNNLIQGRDTSVCILNYKADGTPFWNQLSIGSLLDAHGQIANNVGVLCEVKQMPPADFRRLLHRVPLPESLLNDSSDSGDDAAEHQTVSRSKYSTAASPAADKNGNSNSNISSSNGSSNKIGAPRVVDRLRRTRAAVASAAEHSYSNHM